ncbi:MAG: sulfurtransferase complex subunit TusC [Psychrobium sp.]|nr:sulfurtransferase complex subunit TusC [Psychrobium sp.]
MKNLAIINSTAPFGNINYRESLDMLLANASYDRPVALFFTGDGLYQLMPHTNAALSGNKDLSKTYGLLEMYDVEQVYFCQASLTQRNIAAAQLIVDGEPLSEQQWFAKLAQFDQVINF